MKLLREIPEAAMVAAFLRAELSSVRFSGELKDVMRSLDVDETTIAQPDITNEQGNELRARVLGKYRGYRQDRAIFKGFPDNLSWYEAELSRDETSNLRYVDYSYWNELTDHTHLVKDAVANIKRGKVVFNVSNDPFLIIAERIRHGDHNFEPIILWGKKIGSPLTILEGHLRATAFGLLEEDAPLKMKVLVGLTE